MNLHLARPLNVNGYVRAGGWRDTGRLLRPIEAIEAFLTNQSCNLAPPTLRESANGGVDRGRRLQICETYGCAYPMIASATWLAPLMGLSALAATGRFTRNFTDPISICVRVAMSCLRSTLRFSSDMS